MTSRVSISFYDVGGSQSDRNIIIINDIHVDIKDYIVPAACNLEDFRQMRADFEWENKFTVNTTLTDLHKYIENLLGSTNMKCLTPAKISGSMPKRQTYMKDGRQDMVAEGLTVAPIVEVEELKKLDEIAREGGWAIEQEEIDYM
ncbi:hypothetical protein QYM36_008284 [Artemia franciscana]|uniref:Coatomer beta subunit appendage platform domain-containing protein n=1 Tax=Artemia franciscana TaxID=6661 RepID=A0AA88IG57_ARTSF|nr:hypothetical protein QYM36_008284 [Artemia franciscana]